MYKKTCIIDCVQAGGVVRIIAGSARGRLLKSPKGMLTRPTLDSTRESLFNILGPGTLKDAAVLDIFAGTGALGLEAVSRGATKAVFIDSRTGALIRENALLCRAADRCTVLAGDYKRMLAHLQGERFDYIFADPPYVKNFVNETIALIFRHTLLRSDGLLLMEHSSREPIADSPLFTIIRKKTYGSDTQISFIRGCKEGV